MPEQEQWLGAPVPDMREASFFLWPPECGRWFPFCAVQTNSVLSLCLGLVLPHHNPNEMRLINELLISFATTRRHIRLVLRPSSCVLRHRSPLDWANSCCSDLALRLGSCNIILLWGEPGRKRRSWRRWVDFSAWAPSAAIQFPARTMSECERVCVCPGALLF